jgi:hypothetical protein
MRYLFVGLLAFILITGCQGNDKPAAAANAAVTDSSQFTTIQWLDSSMDYKNVPEGTQLEVAFRFKNTGDKPLVIERVQPSCGCTVAKENPAPVPPGGEGVVKASFNSAGRSGANHKTLFVYANTKGIRAHTLQFVVQVDKKAEETKN